MTIKEQADALIKKYMPYASGIAYEESGVRHQSIGIQTFNATQCAMLEVEGVMNALEKATQRDDVTCLAYCKTGIGLRIVYAELTALLTELKSRL